MYEDLKARIKKHEGFLAKVYLDSQARVVKYLFADLSSTGSASFDVVIDALIGRRNLVGGSIPFASSRGMHRWGETCQKSPELSFW